MLGAYLLLAVATCILLAEYHGWRGMPLLDDNMQYFFIAERVSEGVPPYVSQFEPKNALCVILTGGAIRLGELFGVDAVTASRLLSLAILAGLGAMTMIFVHSLTGRSTAAVAAGAVLFSFSSLIQMGIMGSRPKVFLIFFMMATLLAFRRERIFLSGFLGGCCFLCWQPGLLVPAVLGFLVLFGRWTGERTLLERGLAYASGGALSALLYLGYFLLQGMLGEAGSLQTGLDLLTLHWHQSYVFPSEYLTGGAGFPGFAAAWKKLVETWEWGFSEKAAVSGWQVRHLNWMPLLAAAGAIRYVCHLLGFWKLPEFTHPRGPAWWAFLGLLVPVLAFTFIEHQGAPDLFFMLPFLAVLAGLLVHFLASDFSRPEAPGMGRILGAIGCLLVVLGSSYLAGQPSGLLYNRGDEIAENIARQAGSVSVNVEGDSAQKAYGRLPFLLADQKIAATRIDEWHAQGDTIASVGSTHLLGMADLSNWDSYGLFYRGVDAYVRDAHETQAYRPDLVRGTLPQRVLLSRRAPEKAETWTSLYQEVENDVFNRQGIRVLELKPVP